MVLLSTGRDRCQECRSLAEKAGYWIVVGGDPGGKKLFLCAHHLQSALWDGLIPLRGFGSES